MALATIDSSGELPPDTPSGPRLEPEVGMARRDLVASPRMVAGVRRVARRRGVSVQDLEDVVQETIAQALAATLPEADGDVRRYVLTIASHVASRHVGRLKSAPVQLGDGDEWEEGADGRAIAQAVPFDDRDAIERLVERGHSISPRWFPVFLRAKILGESTEDVARSEGESPGQVRYMWSRLYEDLGDYGRRLGLAVGMLVLLVTGLAAWRSTRRAYDFDAMAPYPFRRSEPPAPDAFDIAHRAIAECRRGEWAACSDDAAAAVAMDPAVDTPQFGRMRALADHERLVRRVPAPKPAPEKP
jgi:DNA-directed RNA polymerase specialized sigma24 family protein